MQSKTAESKKHYDFFDSMRNITMLCVVLYHAVIAYSSTTPQFPIHDTDPIAFSDYVRWSFDVFMMPIFFFISGFFTLASLRNRNLTSFYKGKLRRIALPWFAVMISIIAPIFIFAQKIRPAFVNREIISFGDVLIDMFKGFLQPWNPSYGSTQMHLWFLSLLFIFFVVTGIIYKAWERIADTSSDKNVTQGVSEKSIVVPLLVFGLFTFIVFLVAIYLMPRFNDFVFWGVLVFEPTKLIFNAGFFALGVYGYSRNWFTEEQKMGSIGFWIIVLVISVVAYFGIGMEALVERAIPEGYPLVSLVIFSLARAMFCLSAFMVMILLAIRFWSSTSEFSKKVSNNSYHIYIIHLLIVFALSAGLMKWQGGPTWIKLIIVFSLTLIISYLISHFITNRFPKITLVGLLVICCLLAFFLNPHRYEKQFDQRQVAFKEKLSQTATDQATLRNDSILSFKKALDEPEKYASEAFEKLSLALHNQPDDYEIMSYLGRASVMLLPPDKSANTFDSLVHVVKGYNWVDLAVEKDPENVMVRLSRAQDSIKQIPFLEREKYALIDFEYLGKRIKEDPSIDKSIKEEVFSSLISLYDKAGRSKESERVKKELQEL